MPATTRAATDMELPQSSYGRENQAFKILVVYATRAGSTIEVAQAIGKKLAAGGALVDVKPVKKAVNVKDYQAVVLGSAIRRGAVLPEIMDFVKTNKEDLKDIPVACFIVCMILREDNEQNRAKAASYIKPLQDELSFVDVGLFTGKLDYAKINFIDAFIIKYFIGTPEGDLRDWRKINDWAENLGAELKNK
ncbi:MAG TPA: flavodoxin domain-containing protein [Smithellaceae bacterium]|nr:flavodoxin domain-containing protein [Smithellaceae bacterium]HRS89233.1 flavodoxin domain-containing protein [Smithellaceae bacterium]HRV26309.1 flavodoxin domain-containing protein [Smithellaceae bacterium]